MNEETKVKEIPAFVPVSKPDYNIFYNGNRTLTHNCLFNFIVGSRGAGKTFWFKKWAIEDFIKNEKIH